MAVDKKYRGIKAIIKLSAVSSYDDYVVYKVDDDNELYDDNRIINQCITRETEGDVSINAIGNISSNRLTLDITDTVYNSLLCSNSDNNEFNKLLGNDVEIELQALDENNNTTPYGKYYIYNWSIVDSNYMRQSIRIDAYDILNAVGNKDISELKLPAYAGTVVDMVDSVFNSLGLAYKISTRISKKKKQYSAIGITSGKKVRDLLNNINSILQSRMVVSRENIIMIVPALSDYGAGGNGTGEVWDVSDSRVIDSYNRRSSDSNDYDRATVRYTNVIGNETDVLFTISDVNVPNKEVYEMRGLSLAGKAVSIDHCRIRTAPKDKNNNFIELSCTWVSYQDGIDITIYNNTRDSGGNRIAVDGVVIEVVGNKMKYTLAEETANLSKYRDSNKTKYNCVVDVDFIYDKETATDMVSSTVEYIDRMESLIEISCIISPYAKLGDLVNLLTSDYEYGGTYKVVEMEVNHSLGSDFYVRLGLILNKELTTKIYSNWDDLLKWDDELVWEDDGIEIIEG